MKFLFRFIHWMTLLPIHIVYLSKSRGSYRPCLPFNPFPPLSFLPSLFPIYPFISILCIHLTRSLYHCHLVSLDHLSLCPISVCLWLLLRSPHSSLPYQCLSHILLHPQSPTLHNSSTQPISLSWHLCLSMSIPPIYSSLLYEYNIPMKPPRDVYPWHNYDTY